ncbi:hypothetical protein [Clostridium sp. Cult1]|jgi:hypothetical protein|nr:hypothetical protein [Clostridium sp. Cult1]
MNLKKRIALLIAIGTIIINLGTAVFAEAVFIPPYPIRDSIVEKL